MELISRLSIELKLNNSKKPNSEKLQKTRIVIFPKKLHKWPISPWTDTHQRNADQNINEPPLHAQEDGRYMQTATATTRKKSTGEDVDKLEPWCVASRNVNGVDATENSLVVPQKNVHIELPLLDIRAYPWKLKTGTQTGTWTPIFIAASFTPAKR